MFQIPVQWKMWNTVWKFNNKFNTKILKGVENVKPGTYVYRKDIFLYFVYQCLEAVNLFCGLVKSDKLASSSLFYDPSYILGKKLRYFVAYNIRIRTIAKWNRFSSSYCCILRGILDQFFITYLLSYNQNATWIFHLEPKELIQ